MSSGCRCKKPVVSPLYPMPIYVGCRRDPMRRIAPRVDRVVELYSALGLALEVGNLGTLPRAIFEASMYGF